MGIFDKLFKKGKKEEHKEVQKQENLIEILREFLAEYKRSSEQKKYDEKFEQDFIQCIEKIKSPSGEVIALLKEISKTGYTYDNIKAAAYMKYEELLPHWENLPHQEKEKSWKPVPELISLLSDRGWETCNSAASSLGEIAEKAPEVIKPAIPVLIRNLNDGNTFVSEGAALAISEISMRAPEVLKSAVPSLINFLDDKNEKVRISAIIALGKLGVKDPEIVKPVIPKLINFLDDEDVYVRKNAALALVDITCEIDRDIKKKAVEILGKTKYSVAVKSLISLLDKDYDNLASAAAKALGEIRDASAVEPLIHASKNKDGEVRRAAEEALERIQTKKS